MTYRLLFTQARILWIAVVFAAVGAAVAQSWTVRGVALAFGLIAAFVIWFQRRARPELVIDARGYAVVEHGREKLRVGWDEVVQVRADDAEHALYVDCGDPARNLLVPPRRGYGFRFERAEALFAEVIALVPDRVQHVERLDRPGKA